MRKLLLCSLMTMALATSFAAKANTFVYVSNAAAGEISYYQLDEKTGKMTFLNEISAGSQVMPTAISPDHKYFYAETRAKPYSIVSWKINPANGDLIDKQVNPIDYSLAYIATDRQGHYLLGASYGQNVVVSYRLQDGKLSQAISVMPTGPHAHSVIVDKTNHSLYVGNLGVDKVLQYSLAANGSLSPIGSGSVATAKDNGPRHSVISPDNRFVYNIGEMGGIITQFSREKDGSLKKGSETYSAVAGPYKLAHGKVRDEGYNDPTPRIWASDIKITPNGDFIYVSERTSSTVAGYKVNKSDGHLTLVGVWKTETQPRGIAVSPDSHWLITSGEKSNFVSVYRINQTTGRLTFVQRVIASQAQSAQDACWIVAENLTDSPN